MKKIVSITIVLLALFVLNGCGEEVQPENQIQQTDSITDEIPGQDDNSPTLDEADTNEDIIEVDETEVKDKGLLDEAVSGDLDITKCNSIEDDIMRNFCIKDITTALAKESNDPSMCDQLKIKEDKEYCRNAIPVVANEN